MGGYLCLCLRRPIQMGPSRVRFGDRAEARSVAMEVEGGQ